ncbi:hypothetical protein B0T13DRAFT_448484 [Neurospora crassa]|nr:hypothetical protein B0T13DRAFT_448484 [Neurospora crassa]
MAFGRGPRTPHTGTTGTTTTTTGTTRGDRPSIFNPILSLLNIFVWISSVIVLGIAAYEIHQFKKYYDGYPGARIVYILVIAVLTVAFFLLSFLLHPRPGYTLLFNLIFSYLWLVSVVFAAQSWSSRHVARKWHAMEAFTFIAFFGLFFNTLYAWWQQHRAAVPTGTTTAAVV